MTNDVSLSEWAHMIFFFINQRDPQAGARANLLSIMIMKGLIQ